MLTRRKALGPMHGKRLTLALSVLFGFALLAMFLADKAMANDCFDCDNCESVITAYYECFHTQDHEENPPYYPWPTCEGKCMKNLVFTASCQPNQGDEADGCDTQRVHNPDNPDGYPSGSCRVYEYPDPEDVCLSTGAEEYKVWLKTYYGCDGPEDPYNAGCTKIEHWAACHALSCDTYGPNVLLERRERWPAQLECGCD